MKRASIYSLALLSSVTLLLSACGANEPEATPLSTAATSSHTGAAPAVHMELKEKNAKGDAVGRPICKVYNTPPDTAPVVTGCPNGDYVEQLFDKNWSQVGERDVVVGSPTSPTPPPAPNPTPGTSVYSQTFDSVPEGSYRGSSDLNVQTCSGKGRCLQARYHPNAEGSPRLSFRETLPAAREYTLTYDLRFDKDFEWVRGGKLPGLAPANSITGCEAAQDNGWSVRLIWRKDGSFMQYLYHQDKDESCGENVYAQNFTLQKDRWYKVALYVKVNSSASAKDGQVLLYVDGNEVARRDNLRLRNTSTGGLIESFLFSSFYGGAEPKWAPSRTTYAYFDNFTVHPGLRTQ